MTTPTPKDPESAFGSKEKPVHDPIPLTPDLDPPGADRLGLSKEEIDQFRESGFVVKRGLIPASEFAPIFDLYWQQAPVTAASMRRDDPGTWYSPGRYWPDENRWDLAANWMGASPWPTPQEERPGADVGERVGRLAHKLTKDIGNDVWRWHGIGHDPDFVARTSAHPNVLHMAEAIMGGPVKRPHRSRGIYSLFPRQEDDPDTGLGPHMDQTTTEMIVVTFLQDVEPRSGGFTIYPTSPQLLYPTSEQAVNWVATDASQAAADHIVTNVQPYEFTGKAGDVLFCHGWMVHSAGIHENESIRMAVIQDFSRYRPRTHLRWSAAGKNGGPRVHGNMAGEFVFPLEDNPDDPSDGTREVTTLWIMDNNEFAAEQRPPFDDMFQEWNLGQREVEGNVVNEMAWWDKYGLPCLPQSGAPRGGGGVPAVSLADIARYDGDGIWRVTATPRS